MRLANWILIGVLIGASPIVSGFVWPIQHEVVCFAKLMSLGAGLRPFI